MPYSEFKGCKAFRHAASCQEVQLYSNLGLDPQYLYNIKDIES